MDKALVPLNSVVTDKWLVPSNKNGLCPGGPIPLPPPPEKTTPKTQEVIIQGELQIRSKGPKIFTLRHLVMAYAILYLIVKACQFGKDVKVSVDMAVVYSQSPREFYRVLHEKANKVLWQSPTPLPHRMNPISLIVETLESAVPDKAQMKTDAHVWGSFVFLQGLEYLFAWLLVLSVKNKTFEGLLAWICFAVPVFFLYVFQLLTNVLLTEMLDRRMEIQMDLCVELMLQGATLLMALVYMKRCLRFGQTFQLPTGFPGDDTQWKINLKSSGNPILLV